MAQFDTDVKDPGDILPVDEAAQQSGLSRRTIFRLVEQGVISKYRRAGDRRTFVSMNEVRTSTGFRETRAPYDP